MKSKKYIGIALAIFLSFCVLALVSCASNDTATEAPTTQPTQTPTEAPTDQPTEDNTTIPENTDYTLTFVDFKGNVLTDISGIITLSDGTIVPIAKGISSFNAKTGTYDAQINVLIGADKYELPGNCTFTYENKNVELTIYNKTAGKNNNFYANFDGAYYLYAGATKVKLDNAVTAEECRNLLNINMNFEGARSYFLFNPTIDGVYKISIETDGEATVGCYGGSVMNVFEHSIFPVENNEFEISVHKSMISSEGTNTYVLGITADKSVTEATIYIDRVSDVPPSILDIPWTNPTVGVLSKHSLSYQNKIVTLNNLDLMDTNLTVVLNKNDGYYHLGTADGPLVYVRLTTPITYFGNDDDGNVAMSSFQNMFDGAFMGAYFYDENGNPLKKEQYNDAMAKYYEVVDASGVYPLDELLAYMIKNHGEHAGWWDSKSPNNLFDFYGADHPPVENAWLFAMCTATFEDAAESTQTNPYVFGVIGNKLLATANKTYYLALNELSTANVNKLTIKAPDGVSVVYYGVTYTPENGVITIRPEFGIDFKVVCDETIEGEVEVSYSYTKK